MFRVLCINNKPIKENPCQIGHLLNEYQEYVVVHQLISAEGKLCYVLKGVRSPAYAAFDAARFLVLSEQDTTKNDFNTRYITLFKGLDDKKSDEQSQS